MATHITAGRGTRPLPDENPCVACEVREFAVCGALDPEELAQLSALMTQVMVEAQGTVLCEGDPATFLFNIVEGTIRVHKLLPDGRRQITGFLYPGDFLGLAVHDSYAYSAEAITDSRLCRFPRDDFYTLMRQMPRLEQRLLGMASNELIEAQDQILLLGRKTAQEKIASFFLMISRRAARRGQPENPIHLPMGRTDIADFLGLTTETVSRTFTQLKTSHVIRLLENSQVLLADQGALSSIAQGQ
ncbi:MAG TPA: cyclic nucleotide-binding domain-containing protein [Alphaproteobacteria bacterium]|nr:cyclic nucleotide-binding domain-containing protein [Alphaproteobacteria bacterium]